MGEIKTPLTHVGDDIDGDPLYLITADHTVADVIRWCVEQGGDSRTGWQLELISMILEN